MVKPWVMVKMAMGIDRFSCSVTLYVWQFKFDATVRNLASMHELLGLGSV
jgi:hypothetical protein